MTSPKPGHAEFVIRTRLACARVGLVLGRAYDPAELRDWRGRWGKGAGGLLPDPPDADLRASLLTWTKHRKNSSRIQRDVTKLVRNRDAQASDDAKHILGALQNRSAPGPELYRGMSWPPGDPKAARFISKLKVGGTIDLPIASFTSDETVSRPFSPPADGRETGTSVLITVEPGAQAFDIASGGGQAFQKEQITGGRYEVVSVATRPVPQATLDGYRQMGLSTDRLLANADRNYAVTLRQVQGV